MLGHVRVEGTLGHEVQESGERPGRDTLAPMLLADPIPDEADTVLGPVDPSLSPRRALLL